jgi:hypothetical protein
VIQITVLIIVALISACLPITNGITHRIKCDRIVLPDVYMVELRRVDRDLISAVCRTSACIYPPSRTREKAIIYWSEQGNQAGTKLVLLHEFEEAICI